MSNTFAISSDSSSGAMPKDTLSSDHDLDLRHKSTPWWQRIGQNRRGSMGFSDAGIGSGTTPPASFYGTTPHSPHGKSPNLPTVIEGRRDSFVTSSTLARSHQEDASINLDPSGQMFLEVDREPQFHSGDIYDLAEGEINRKGFERKAQYNFAVGDTNVKGQDGKPQYHSGDIYDLAEEDVTRMVQDRKPQHDSGENVGRADGDVVTALNITRRVKSEAITGEVNIDRIRNTSGMDHPENFREKDQLYASLVLTPKHTVTPPTSNPHSRHTSGSTEPEEQLFDFEGSEEKSLLQKPPKELVSGLLSSVVNSWFFKGTDRDDEVDDDNADNSDKYQYRDGVQLVFNQEEADDTRKKTLLNQVKYMVNENPQRLREMNHWAPQNH